MHRRKVVVMGAALFAIGVAFAAQPTSMRANRVPEMPQDRSPWTPGTGELMSAHESNWVGLAPPR